VTEYREKRPGKDEPHFAAVLAVLLAGRHSITGSCGGHVAITARPYRRHGELVDIPGLGIAAGQVVGLELIEECVVLMADVRNRAHVPRGVEASGATR
jgi:hypothetical protein